VLDMEAVVAAAENLEPVPASVSRLAGLVSDPESDIRDVVEVVSHDQALTATVLRYANSAASAPRVPIVTVRDAVNRVGRNQVLSTVLGAAVERWMRAPVPAYGIEANELWEASLYATVVAENLAFYCRVEIPRSAASTALLADVGKVALARCLDEETLEFFRRARTEGALALHRAEMEVLGVHHGEVGAVVARHWGLPEEIAVGIQYHHDPEAGDELIVYATALACAIAETALPGDEGQGTVLDPPEWLGRLGLGPDDLEPLRDAATIRFGELQASAA